MAKFNERLRQLRNSKGWTQNDLAKRIDIGSQAISQYERGVRRPDQETLLALCDAFNVSSDYLLGETDITVRLVDTDEMLSIDANRGSVKIPVYGRVRAGIPDDAIEDIIDTEEISPDMVKDGSEFMALQIHGDSMEPKFSEGDVVIVRKQPDVESGQIAIVMVNKNDATCKRVRKYRDGVELIPSNPNYDPIFYSNEQIEKLPVTILGRVVELRAKF